LLVDLFQSRSISTRETDFGFALLLREKTEESAEKAIETYAAQANETTQAL
jgi:hypothetical protein